MQYLQVKNWEKFQHYKDRSPPWIKLHRDLLRDYDFIRLQDASKLHLMLIWLLASQMDNKIPADSEFIKKQIGVTTKINFKELIDNGFLVDDSNALATRKQSAIPETETEAYSKETETEKEYMSDFEVFWDLYPRKDGSKAKAKELYLKAIRRGITHERIERGVRAYANSTRGTEKKYIAHATTWLNQERWESDYTDTGKPAIAEPNKSERAKAAIMRGLEKFEAQQAG